ncbi:cysteine dioxygenase [Geminicoccaceae bacterium 1502E]|nr:cysteine dioxygenase [Geminicoccaceae bacterium 1502E]
MTKNTRRLRTFLAEMSALVEEAGGEEAVILKRGKESLRALVAHDDWLPEDCAEPHPERYRQYLLYCDPRERFSVVSFVWGPGQETPVHDHTVWGLVGMLRGSELSQSYELSKGGPVPGRKDLLKEGEVVAVSPRIGDIHKVSNAETDRTSISIHVYGGDIGAIERHVFPMEGGEKSFISGYSNGTIPNIWGVAR